MEEAQKIKAESMSDKQLIVSALPPEILIDIIARLPVSSLLQIKLVCRAWRRLLQDPHLPCLHFSRLTASPSHHDPSLILQSRSSANNEIHFLDLSAVDNDDNDAQPELKKLSVPSTIPIFILLGSCRGILCLANVSHRVEIYLYNPLLAEIKKIPTPKCGPSYILGFGFHPATKEYKMVTIAAVFDGASIRFRTAISPGSVISVLTMAPSQKATEPSKPNTWRRLGLFPYHFVTQTHQVPVSGRLHWAARRKDRESRKRLVIMSFDLSDETIREVSTVLPFCRCERNCHCRFDLMVVESCLGIAEYKVRGEIKIWVMKEYGVEDSWVNEITIDGVDTLGRELGLETTTLSNPDGVRRPSSGTYFHMISDFRVLWVLRNGEVLLEFKRRGLVLYDPMNGVLKNVLSSVGGGGFLVDGFNAIVHEGSFCDIDACMDM